MILALCSIGALVVLLVLQVWSLVSMQPRIPVGDENGYLAQAQGQQRARLFLRVPMVMFVARLVRGTGDPERAMRAVSASFGMATVGLLGYAAYLLSGWSGVLTTTLFLLLLPERLILNNHIWSDSLITTWLAAINLSLVFPLNSWATAATLGILVCASVLTRIDQVVLLVAVPLAFAIDEAITLAYLSLICGPAIAALILLSVRNYLRHGLALPDNTLMFNLGVARAELESKEVRKTIQSTVITVVPTWRKLAARSQIGYGIEALSLLLQQPFRFAGNVLSRAWSLLGPDSFVTDRLLPPNGGAYPAMPENVARYWRVLLRVSFPMVAAFLLVFAQANPTPIPGFVIPVLFLFLTAAALHSRTRYRMALIPGLALWAAIVIPSSIKMLTGPWCLALAVAAMALSMVLIRFQNRRDL